MPLRYRPEQAQPSSRVSSSSRYLSPSPSSSVMLRQLSPTLLATVQLADADDSIVLSDLLRTGEASRLRRRGALRLDHAALGAPRTVPRPARRRVVSLSPSLALGGHPSALPAPAPISSPIVVPPSPSWTAPQNNDDAHHRHHHPTDDDDDDDDDDDADVYGDVDGDDDRFTQTSEQADLSPTDVVFDPHPEPDSDLYNHVLFCGGQDSGTTYPWTIEDTPYEPSPLPQPLSPLPSLLAGRSARHSCTPSRMQGRKINGCGAVVHLRAWRRERCSVWVGKDAASNAVVPMDAAYFESPTVRVVRSSCGCIREGVGCAICGNTLGTRHTLCQSASVDLFPRRHSSSGVPPCPEGPRYWHGLPARPFPSSSRPTHTPCSFYTFFSSHVSASYADPRRSVSPRFASRESSLGLGLGLDLMGRGPSTSEYGYEGDLADSPPRMDDERERMQIDVGLDMDGANSGVGVDPQVDPDGVLLVSGADADADALDKVVTELVVLPER